MKEISLGSRYLNLRTAASDGPHENVTGAPMSDNFAQQALLFL